jgi:DNA-binding phage protein
MTTDAQKMDVFAIATEMARAGVPRPFVVAAAELAQRSEGAYDLMVLWKAAETEEDRGATISDIQELLDDEDDQPTGVETKPYLRFDHLDDIAKSVMTFKAKLRKKVEAAGGISELARKSGIPQPSLSRFFNTASMPRTKTLYRIAEALGLDESEIVTEWRR